MLSFESPSKIMKSVFVSSEHLFSFSRYLRFSFFCVFWKTLLVKKSTENHEKFCDVSKWPSIYWKHFLLNISGEKNTTTIKLYLLIEWFLRNILIKKLHRKCTTNLSSRLFWIHSNLQVAQNQTFVMNSVYSGGATMFTKILDFRLPESLKARS